MEAAAKPSSSLAQRALVALTLGPALLLAAYFGGWFYFIPLLVLLTIAAVEYANIMQSLDRQVPVWLMAPVVFAVLVAGQYAQYNLLGPTILLGMLVVLFYALKLYEWNATSDAAFDWFAMVTGIMLVGWLGAHFFLLRNRAVQGFEWTALTFIAIWTADMGAFATGKFLAGRILPRHRLAPRLSPNKTVEGYLGGIVASVFCTWAVALILDLPVPKAVVIGTVIAIIGVVGDLSISLLKREAGVKDTGKLFPGHGGVLDRMDSVLWSMAIAYYMLEFLSFWQ
jgi:phosphatidate cytidylyltransferase